jgi:hypothetical protein
MLFFNAQFIVSTESNRVNIINEINKWINIRKFSPANATQNFEKYRLIQIGISKTWAYRPLIMLLEVII